MNQRLPQGVIFVIGLAILLNYVDRGSLATAGPVLQDELSLSSSQMGLLLSAFWMYAPSQLLPDAQFVCRLRSIHANRQASHCAGFYTV